MLSGNFSKFYVAVVTAITTALQSYYGGAKWEPAVVGGLGALLVYLVPNTPKSSANPPAGSATNNAGA